MKQLLFGLIGSLILLSCNSEENTTPVLNDQNQTTDNVLPEEEKPQVKSDSLPLVENTINADEISLTSDPVTTTPPNTPSPEPDMQPASMNETHPFGPYHQDSDNGNGFGDNYGDYGTGNYSQGYTNSSDKRIAILPDYLILEKSEMTANIVLLLMIDAQGIIVSASCKRSLTTTTNQTLINNTIQAVKKDVVYTKKIGAPLQRVELTITVENEY